MGSIGKLKRDTSLYYQMGDSDTEYFTPLDKAECSIASNSIDSASELGPLTVVAVDEVSGKPISADDLQDTIDSYLEKDDVLTRDWLERIYLVPSSDTCYNKVQLETTAVEKLKEYYGTTDVILDSRLLIQYDDKRDKISPFQQNKSPLAQTPSAGPYLADISTGNIDLYPVYRLYPDETEAYVSGVYPSPDGSDAYKTLDKTDDKKHNLIPVRSRISHPGPRCSLKDIYDLEGVVTGYGNRQSRLSTDIAKTTAPSVKRLVERGMNIVGKGKTTEFIGAGPSIEDTSQFQYPWSVRADGYQSVGGSSCGAASALAASDYLDMAITTDTTGSSLDPAAIARLYGMRSTHGVLPMEGLLPCLKEADTVGIMTRNPSILTDIARTWFSGSPAIKPHKKLPSKIIVPSDDLDEMDGEIKQKFIGFVDKISKTLDIPVEYMNITERGPNVSNGMMSYEEYKEFAYASQWKDFAKEWVEKQKKAGDGRYPVTGSFIRDQWAKAESENWCPENFEQCRSKMSRTGEIFKEILGSDEESVSQSLYVDLWGTSNYPMYREKKLQHDYQRLNPPSRKPLDPIMLSVYSGCPTVVATFDQVPFDSIVSEKEEQHALAVGIMGYPGSDLVLADVIDKLTEANALSTVKTGRTAF